MASLRLDVRTPLACAALVVSCGAGLAGCGSGSSPVTLSSAPALVLTAAFKNAIAGKWVHELVRASEPGHLFSMDSVIGTAAGRQMTDSDGGRSTTIIVNNTAYIRGDLKSVVSYFRISTKNPRAIADKWISISATNPGFAGVNTATLGPDFGRIGLLGPLTKGPITTINGVKTVPIHGRLGSSTGAATASATVYVTAAGPILPVEYTLSSGKIKESISWSEWGQSITIVAPSSSIPVTSIKP